MPPKNEVVDDSTDPGGTLRPNLLPEPTVGTHFTPLSCPEFDYYINLPASVDRHSPIAIFDLFFTPEQMRILVENTNKSGPFHQMGLPYFRMEGHFRRGIIYLFGHLDLYGVASRK
jgi:hypothetical protein